MSIILDGTDGITTPSVTYEGDATINGLTVGRGAGDVATNTAVGASALVANTSGANNVAIGTNTLDANTSGASNTGVGANSLDANTTGGSNSALGYLSLFANTTGTNNSALGRSALEQNTIGGTNTAVGAQALRANSTTSSNTAVGYQAGYSQQTARWNTFIGSQAGYSVSTGEANTFVGNGYSPAGYSMTTGSKNTIIGGFTGNQGGLDIRTSSGYVVLSDGDGNPVFKTQNNASWALQGANVVAGAGISFPATQSASSDANTLDDYEEGTWTPIDSSGAGLTFSATSAKYVKIGRQVTAWAAVTYPSTADASNAAIGGLPFTIGPNQCDRSGGMIGYKTDSALATILGEDNTTYVKPRDSTGTTVTNASLSADTIFWAITYGVPD